jgi:hypothetical protein
MRFLAILAVSAAVLMPALASADPGQTQAAPAATDQSATAPAPAQRTAQANTSTASDADLDRIECRTSPPATGTRLGGTRECHSVRDWNQRQQDAQDDLKRTQMLGHQAQGLNTPGGK